jgi:hypothetical protein
VKAMGIFDAFKKKEKSEEDKAKEAEAQKLKQKATPQIDIANSKYPDETCAVCSQKGCDKKWGGQYWHKKCLRSVKGMARDMI